ncbi:MAG: threonine/serine exporter family protein [Clostridia bacterium]|nr:threonine/serine exporter family protein [Clostridia bacterium]
MFDMFIEVLMAGLGSAGFAYLFNVHGKKIAWTGIGGGLSWLVYLAVMQMSGDLFIALFAATLSIVVASEILARAIKIPVIMMLVPMLIPLVPGGTLFYSMQALISGKNLQFVGYLQSLALQAAAIAVGMIVGTAIMGNFFTFYYRAKAQKISQNITEQS